MNTNDNGWNQDYKNLKLLGTKKLELNFIDIFLARIFSDKKIVRGSSTLIVRKIWPFTRSLSVTRTDMGLVRVRINPLMKTWHFHDRSRSRAFAPCISTYIVYFTPLNIYFAQSQGSSELVIVHRPSICPSGVRCKLSLFDFSSKTAEQNSRKLDRKQDLNVVYQVCVFRPLKKKKATLQCCWNTLEFCQTLVWQNSRFCRTKQNFVVIFNHLKEKVLNLRFKVQRVPVLYGYSCFPSFHPPNGYSLYFLLDIPSGT